MENFRDFLKHADIKFKECENHFAVKNPANGEILAFIKKTNANEISRILTGMQKAQKEWANLNALQRSDIMLKWHEKIVQNREMLAEIMTLEQGKAIKEARGEIDYAASFVRWFAEECRRIDGDILTPLKQTQKLFVINQPIGICAAITPWNFPSSMITRKAAPALACGCAMIVKSASATPLSAYALQILAQKAGIPNDVFIIVNGDASEISDAFCKSDTVRKITFTGSTEVGSKIYEKSAKTIKKISLELGGNAPVIVFDDANLQKAVDGVIASKFRNSGQTCVCANRVYAQSGIYDALCEKLVKKVKEMKIGEGIKEDTDFGPLINESAVEKVEELIKDALNKGAKCLLGGKRSTLGGTFFEPTILNGATSKMKFAKEEIFGPLCPIFKFENIDDVINQTNDTKYGLASYIFTENLNTITKVSEALEYGMVGVNTGLISNEVAPFGGVKMSGLGREGSKYGIAEYMQKKYICVDIK